MKISEDFEELFEYFNDREVRYLIVGAHAVAFHAKPRYTKGLDVFVDPTQDNGGKIIEALEDFGFRGLDLSADDFSTPGNVIQLGIPPHRIDFVTSIEAVDFRSAWNSRVEGSYGSIPVWYIGRDALIRNKKALGRDQDKMDVSWLEST